MLDGVHWFGGAKIGKTSGTSPESNRTGAATTFGDGLVMVYKGHDAHRLYQAQFVPKA